jgi:dUTP pyrophosphatase
MLKLQVELIHPLANIPAKAHKDDAGLDISTVEWVSLEPGEYQKVDTGIIIHLPLGHYGQLCSRSGISLKKGLVVHQGVGVIDCGYSGELAVLLRNTSNQRQTVQPGTKIAQLLILPVPVVDVVVGATNVVSMRGTNGFGSTDLKQNNEA